MVALLGRLQNLVAAVVELATPLVSKLTERFGVRVTAIGAATAVFIGSTGGTAWAITSMEDPAPAPNTNAAYEAALSESASAAAANAIAAQQMAKAAAEAEEAEAARAAEAAEAAAEPKPVGGLSDSQMANAVAIIEAGEDKGLGRDAWAVALATAMQESKLKNYANVNVPESYDFNHQAEGSDHDSVGLFQQRPSSGWGSVEELMDPKTSASKFYGSLKKVKNWEDMPVTRAAQTVQVSAYPDAYAQWEDLAWKIVESYEAARA